MEYLKERVLVQVYERLEFKKHDDFEGYIFMLED